MVVKKGLLWVTVICLLLESLLGFAAADTGEDNAATSGVDVVVALDMSGSMTTRNDVRGNDDNGFRIDATAMLIGMVDMDGSRVGIVPFAGTVLNQGIKNLTDVKTVRSRETYITELYDRIAKVRGDNTNIGAALMTALQMLDSREDKSNRPMIVLLTDGKNAIANPVSVDPSYRWTGDEDHREISNRGRETYDTAKANVVTEEAVACADALGVPIYTVGLTLNPYESSPGSMTLAAISQMTGARCEWAKEKEDAKEIPDYFAKILADKIGSSVQKITSPRLVSEKDKLYEVPIPVLNESIREINVILPVKKGREKIISSIEADSIEVYDARGEIQTEGGVLSILRSDKGSFAMIKIRKPVRGSTGMWKLRFRSTTDPSKISFNFLYNYDIKLNAEVSTTRADDQYYKSDNLHLSAFFADEEGNRSSDFSLYADHTNEADFEDWMTIRAKWELYEVDNDGRIAGRPIKDGTMEQQDMPLQFGCDVNLVGSGLKAGQYRLIFTAEGAGLIRTVELPLFLKNHIPQGVDHQDQVDVNLTESGKEHTWTVNGTSGVIINREGESTEPLKVGDLVRDEDPDDQANMYYHLVADPDQEQAATMELQADGTIRYTTILEGGRIKEGDAKYRLDYNDGDQDGSGSVYVTLYVMSDWDKIKRTYEPEMNVSGTKAADSTSDSEFLKNSPLMISVKLKKKDGSGYDDGDTLERLANDLSIINTKTGEAVIQGSVFVRNGDALEYTVESTGNKEATWQITTKIGYFDELSREVRIPNNHGPEAAAAAEELVFNCSGEKVPSFLRTIIGEDTPEDDPARVVSVSELFSDKDHDILIYSEPVFKSPDGLDMDSADISAQPKEDAEPGVYVIQATGDRTSIFNFSYQGKMEITATDGDGRQATYEQKITVVDLYNKMLTYLAVILAAVIILVILFLIIHQIRKPRFPRLNLTIREEPSLYESGSETLSPVKTPTNVNAMGVDSDMAAKHGISMELLQNIIIKPIRSMLAVGVVCKKSIPGQEVLLDDVRLKAKKLYTWKIAQELCIHNNRSESMITIKLENRDTSEEEDVLEDFGGSDDWSDAGAAGNMAKAGRKRGRKVERKAKQAEQDDTLSGSNDDFDF